MQRLIAIISLCVILTMTSCHRNPGTVKIQVKPMFGNLAYQKYTTYSCPNGQNYKFSMFKMFLSHIKLVRTDNSTVEIDPLVYIDADSADHLYVPEASVPSGSYKGIQLGIGIDSIQDNTDPNSYTQVTPDPLNPYNNYDMYWTTTLKYVFVRLEGDLDSANGQFGTLFLYHVGTNPYYTTISVNKNFSVSDGSQTVLNLNTDLQKLFYGISNPLLPSELVTQTSDNLPLAQKFITDFGQTFSLQ